MAQKGANLEELVRAYFDLQGYFALRGISYRYDGEEVTDIDVWLYGRHSASVRTCTIVDVKNKRSPKAFERILWARGMQLALGCDRAVVATTDRSPKIARYADQQKVALLTTEFLDRLQSKLQTDNRMTLEQFVLTVQEYKDHKHDGNWLKQISDAKSALVSNPGYPAFNRTISAFRFFAERLETRPHHKEQALRGAYLTAALACIALDCALERTVYDDHTTRYSAIAHGVTYGDRGDARVQTSIKTVLAVIAEGMENGRVISRQAQTALNKLFKDVRADIVAEYFTKEQNASVLVTVAKELDGRAHRIDTTKGPPLSIEAKAVLGVYADFVQARRAVLLPDEPHEGGRDQTTATGDEAVETKANQGQTIDPSQSDLF